MSALSLTDGGPIELFGGSLSPTAADRLEGAAWRLSGHVPNARRNARGRLALPVTVTIMPKWLETVTPRGNGFCRCRPLARAAGDAVSPLSSTRRYPPSGTRSTLFSRIGVWRATGGTGCRCSSATGASRSTRTSSSTAPGGRADPLGCGALRRQRVLGTEMGCALAGDGERDAGQDRQPPELASRALPRAGPRAGRRDAAPDGLVDKVEVIPAQRGPIRRPGRERGGYTREAGEAPARERLAGLAPHSAVPQNCLDTPNTAP